MSDDELRSEIASIKKQLKQIKNQTGFPHGIILLITFIMVAGGCNGCWPK